MKTNVSVHVSLEHNLLNGPSYKSENVVIRSNRKKIFRALFSAQRNGFFLDDAGIIKLRYIS